VKILTVIGTRPQYIKIKPFCDYLKKEGFNNVLVDTSQHYSKNMSESFIEDFDLFISYKLKIKNKSPIQFISNCIIELEKVIKEEKPNIIFVVGDTNSTLAAALTANKMNIKLAHLEAGVRCGDMNRPEETNRVLTDILSNFHFISNANDKKNVFCPIYLGDLEYILLNQLENEGKLKELNYNNAFLMTIHRHENTNKERLEEIFSKCSEFNKPIIFLMHHRTEKIIKENKIIIPDNIYIYPPRSYLEMLNTLIQCQGIITDSGGVIKISPYFGKKCLIPLETTEWSEVVSEGYGKLGLDFSHFNEPKIKRDRNFYYNRNGLERVKDILNEIN